MASSEPDRVDYDKSAWDDDPEWRDEDDFWKDADADVARDADGKLVVSEEGKRIDARSYKLGWSLVIGTGVLVALIAGIVSLVLR